MKGPALCHNCLDMDNCWIFNSLSSADKLKVLERGMYDCTLYRPNVNHRKSQLPTPPIRKLVYIKPTGDIEADCILLIKKILSECNDVQKQAVIRFFKEV